MLKKLIICIAIAFPLIVDVQSQSQSKILSADKILSLIPEKIKEFRHSTDPKSKVIKLGNIQYAMAEREFIGSNKRVIKILLFDYKQAQIMYNQVTRQWSTFAPIESDSLILRRAVMTDCTGWESYNVYRGNSQILLGVCNRYFLTVEGTNVDLESLKKIVQSFKFETFPK